MGDRNIRSFLKQWAFPLCVFTCGILLMIYSYGMSQYKAVKERTNELIRQKASIEAVSLNAKLNVIKTTAKAMLPLLEKSENSDILEALGDVPNVETAKIVTKDDRIFTTADKWEHGKVSNLAYRESLILYEEINEQQYLLLGCNSEMLRNNVYPASFNGKTWCAVVDTKGIVVMPSGKSTTDLYRGVNLLTLLESSCENENVYQNFQKSMNRGESGYLKVSLNKAETYVSYMPIGTEGWYLITGIPQSYVSSYNKMDIQRLQKLIGALLMFLAVSFIIILNRVTAKNKNLEKKADTDLLTELSNKMATERKIKEYIIQHRKKLAIMCILDIDNFKKINDTMGHAFGDKVLQQVGSKLKAAFRISDIVGRAGGDEFVLFLTFLQDEEEIQKEAKKLLAVFRDLQIGEYTKYSPTASIGCAVYPRDAGDFESLYKAADHALYEAKKAGKNRLEFYKK